MAGVAELILRIQGKDDASASIRDAEEAVKQLSRSLEDAQAPTRGLTKSLYEVGEAGGNAEQGFRGVSDIATFMSEQLGLNLGPLQENAAALADLGGGIEGLLKGFPSLIAQISTVLPLIGAKAAAWWAVAAATIAANAPLIILIATIALVVAGLIYFFTQTETGQRTLEAFTSFITDSLVPALQSIWAFIQNYLLPIIKLMIDLYLLPLKLAWEGVKVAVDFTRDAFGFVVDKAGALIDKLGFLKEAIWPARDAVFAIRDAFYAMRDAIGEAISKAGDLIGKLNVFDDIPGGGLIGGAVGKGRDIFRASGGPVTAGMPYIVGEKGMEVFVPNVSGSIVPNSGLNFIDRSTGLLTEPGMMALYGFIPKAAAAGDEAAEAWMKSIGMGFTKPDHLQNLWDGLVRVDGMLTDKGEIQFEGTGDNAGKAYTSAFAEHFSSPEAAAALAQMLSKIGYILVEDGSIVARNAGTAVATAFTDAVLTAVGNGSLTNILAGASTAPFGERNPFRPYEMGEVGTPYRNDRGALSLPPLGAGLQWEFVNGQWIVTEAGTVQDHTDTNGPYTPGGGGYVTRHADGSTSQPIVVQMTGAVTVNNNGATQDAEQTAQDVGFAIARAVRQRGGWVMA